MTREANGLVSMPVLETETGKNVGRVKDVLFDLDEQSLYGLLLTARAGEMFLARDRVRAFGKDAITVEHESAITPVLTEPRAQSLLALGIRLRGTSVMTETGDSLGTLDKVLLDDDGVVSSYEATKGILGLGVKTEFLPEQVRTIGADAIVISAEDPGSNAGANGTPTGTDPSKETVVAFPDSQPGNLADEELESAG